MEGRARTVVRKPRDSRFWVGQCNRWKIICHKLFRVQILPLGCPELYEYLIIFLPTQKYTLNQQTYQNSHWQLPPIPSRNFKLLKGAANKHFYDSHVCVHVTFISSVFVYLAMTNRSSIRTYTKIKSENFVSLILFSILIMHEISRKLFSTKNYVWARVGGGAVLECVFGFHKGIEP